MVNEMNVGDESGVCFVCSFRSELVSPGLSIDSALSIGNRDDHRDSAAVVWYSTRALRTSTKGRCASKAGTPPERTWPPVGRRALAPT
jgi:hypothetical protein